MHEEPKGKSYQNLGSAISWPGGDRLSAVHWRDGLGPTTYLFGYDGSSWNYRSYQSAQEFNYSIAVIFTSATGFGTGIGFFIQQLFGG